MKATTRFYIDSFLQNMKSVCFFLFLPVLIAKLGATPLQISLSNSVPLLFSAFSLAFLTRQLPLNYGIYFTAGILRQIAFLCMAISPLLPNPIFWMITFWCANSVVVMITSVQQQALLKRNVEESKLTSLFGRTKIIAISVSIVGSFVIGKYLDATISIFPLNYTLAMVVGAIATFAGMSIIAKLAPREKVKIKIGFVRPLKKYPRPLIGITIATISITVMGPLWTIYHVNELGFTNLQIGMFGIFAGLVSTFFIPLVRWAIKLFGPNKVIVVACYSLAIVALCYSYFSVYVILLMFQIVNSLSSVFYEISQQTLAIKESKNHAEELIFFSDYQLVQNMGGAIGPILGGVAVTFLGIHNAFLAMGAFSLVAATCLLKVFGKHNSY